MTNEQAPEKPLLLLPPPRFTPLHSRAGIVALVLIFFASAAFTASYFSNLASQGAAQAASAAAAAAEIDPFAGLKLAAESAFVFDLKREQVLYSKNPDVQLPLASLAKVPLVLVVSEVLPADSYIAIPPHDTPDGAGVRLPAGLSFLAQDLFDFTLVASSNEGAAILADVAAGAVRAKYTEADSREPALWRMNDLAKNLGLTHTYFLNASGLDISPTQAGAYGSAQDIARIFAYAALNNAVAFEQTSRNSVKIRATTGESITAVNTDEALPAIPGLILGKTGITQLAGGNLAVVFEVGPAHPVVAVVLHSTEQGRFADMKALVAATQEWIAGGKGVIYT